MSIAENTVPKQRIVGRPFLPGQSGNPAGKPKGSRHKLNEDFLSKFAADFALHGEEVIAKVREEQPAIWLKIAADLLPRQTTLDAKLDVSVVTETTNTLEAFRTLLELTGADPQAGMRRLKRIAPQIEYHER
jgi:hypothetical protein